VQFVFPWIRFERVVHCFLKLNCLIIITINQMVIIFIDNIILNQIHTIRYYVTRKSYEMSKIILKKWIK